MAIPIFIFHKTNSPYIKYALKQARKFNPDSEIYLMGDSTNDKYDFITHVNVANYSVTADEFIKDYIHLSAGKIEYELNCFLRWFYIRDFVVQNNIESFICVDSDVLVFSDLTEALKPFQHLSIANEGVAMPAFTYFGNKNALINFCDYMHKQYTELHYVKRLEVEWEAYKIIHPGWGGISDMYMFLFYSNEHPENFGKLDQIVNDAIFDQHIRTSDGFEMDGDNKKIRWENGKPYAFHIASQKWIRFHGIHYQGHSKAIMYKHYSGGGYYIPRVMEFVKELRDKYQLRTRVRNLFKG